MDTLLKKLNYASQPAMYVLQAPPYLQPLLDSWAQTAAVNTMLDKGIVQFAMVFCTAQQQVNEYARKLDAMAKGDAIIWFCYPKGSSKKYSCDFNRDNGWQLMGQLGWEPVRMVAIDADWSALRFRRVAYIKTMTRSKAISTQGHARLRKEK